MSGNLSLLNPTGSIGTVTMGQMLDDAKQNSGEFINVVKTNYLSLVHQLLEDGKYLIESYKTPASDVSEEERIKRNRTAIRFSAGVVTIGAGVSAALLALKSAVIMASAVALGIISHDMFIILQNKTKLDTPQVSIRKEVSDENLQSTLRKTIQNFKQQVAVDYNTVKEHYNSAKLEGRKNFWLAATRLGSVGFLLGAGVLFVVTTIKAVTGAALFLTIGAIAFTIFKSYQDGQPEGKSLSFEKESLQALPQSAPTNDVENYAKLLSQGTILPWTKVLVFANSYITLKA